jgi:hypothetical protein
LTHRAGLYQIGRAPPADVPKYHPIAHNPGNAALRNTSPHSSGSDAVSRQPETRPDMPRSEPEIIPPGAEFPRRPAHDSVFDTRNGIRIHVVRPGPLGIAAIIVGAGIVGALSFVMLLGTLLIGAAAAGTIVLIALISRLLRVFSRS